MKIFAWSADPGTAYWRLKLPLGQFAKSGHEVRVSDLMPADVQFHAGVDVLVASRTANTGASETFQRLCAEQQMLCVYETDDDTMAITPDNAQAYRVLGTPEIRANIAANLAAAHLVTTTNTHLASRLREHTDAPIAILPNRVPRWLTELPLPWTDFQAKTVDYCHSGGPSHVLDFAEMERPLRTFLRDRGPDGARFVSFGTDNSARVLHPRNGNIGNTARHVAWRGDVEGYLRSLAGSDVGLAPLRRTLFNSSKTSLKAMEFGSVGAPIIASNVPPYDGYVRHGVTGFLCSTDRDWRRAFEALLDPELRAEMGTAGRAQARENLVEDHAHEWLDAYEQAMAGKVAA